MTAPGARPRSRFPTAVVTLLVINVIAFFIDHEVSRKLTGYFALWAPGSELFRPWQMLTYGFLHANTMHLTVNMLGLMFIGRLLEQFWGTSHFLVYYFFCVFGAAIMQIIVGIITDRPYAMIGASGGVFGLLLALGLIFPRVWVVLLFPPIPIQARYLVIIYGAIELMLGVSGPAAGRVGGIAHAAHLGGMLFGFLLIQFWRGKLWLKPRQVGKASRRGKP